MSPDPDDVGRLENLVSPHRDVKGNSGFIHRVGYQPITQPPRRLAQIIGSFFQRQRLAHCLNLPFKNKLPSGRNLIPRSQHESAASLF
jgi:hypothetical protein